MGLKASAKQHETRQRKHTVQGHTAQSTSKRLTPGGDGGAWAGRERRWGMRSWGSGGYMQPIFPEALSGCTDFGVNIRRCSTTRRPECIKQKKHPSAHRADRCTNTRMGTSVLVACIVTRPTAHNGKLDDLGNLCSISGDRWKSWAILEGGWKALRRRLEAFGKSRDTHGSPWVP